MTISMCPGVSVKSPGALPIRITCPWQNVTELSPFHNTCYASIVNKDKETGKIAPIRELYIYKAIGLRSFIKPFRINGAWCGSWLVKGNQGHKIVTKHNCPMFIVISSLRLLYSFQVQPYDFLKLKFQYL